MAAQNYLAIDLGAESGRAVIGAFDGGKLALEQVHRFANQPVRAGDSLYWDALRLFDDIQSGLERAAQTAGVLQSAGIDTWGVDFGLLDAQGALVGNPVHYRDHRTDNLMPLAFAQVPRERIFEATGIQFMQLNTLYQLYALTRANSPQLLIADTLLMMPDLFNYWLTGEKVAESTIASTTQFYDPRAKDWARGLLQELGIPHHFLPRLVPPATDLGKLPPRLVQTRGLENTRVIAPAGHDTAAAVAAVPTRVQNYAYISSGTWSLMGAEVPAPIINSQTLEYNFTNEVGAGGMIRLLKNISGLWIVQECRRAWAKQGNEYTYAQLTEMAEAAPAFGSLVNVDDPTFLNPDDMPSAIAQYCARTRQTPPTDRAAIVRVALEGLACKYRQTLAQLESVLGKRVEVIHIVGGGSQNSLLCQFTADACGREVLAGPIEATALGNVLLQMLARGEMASLEEGRALVRASFPLIAYEPRETARWDEAYARFEKLIQAG